MSTFFYETDFAVTITDIDNKIVYMNDKAKKTFEKYGGGKLIGTDLLVCHSQKSQEIIKELLNSNKTNVYTIEKNGIKKLIYQTPWLENGIVSGLIELSLELPSDMPHFKRD